MARRKRITQKDICDGLGRLAFGEIQDAVTLLFENEENILTTLKGLDLFNVSEIKRAKGGGMEIKFFDRFKALEKLKEIADESGGAKGDISFFEALEKSAKLNSKICGESFYE